MSIKSLDLLSIQKRKKILKTLLTLVAFFFVVRQISWLSLFHFFDNNTPFYGAFLLLGCATFISIKLQNYKNVKSQMREILDMLLPTALLFAFGISQSHAFHFLVYLSVGLYSILVFAYWTMIESAKKSHGFETSSPKHAHKTSSLIGVIFITGAFFIMGLSHLTQFAAVDEPLWLDSGRISRFWKNLAERDLDKTRISDKPGITVALTSGPGLLFVTPKDYRDTRLEYNAKHPEANIQDFYLAFRLPQLILITLLLPCFYFFLVPLLGKTGALYSYAFIALSPQLIGMSKIVNPDSLLWMFAPLSFLSYIVFQEKKRFRMLMYSGVLFGLALLTKYVANFLVIFFFGYIFLQYLLIEKSSHTTFSHYFSQQITYFGIWLGTALSVFYLLFPAMWLEPRALIESTLLSQAFEKVAPVFIGIIAIIFVDKHLFKARAMTCIMSAIKKHAVKITSSLLIIFIGITLFVLLNGMLSMRWIDFMHILASPKSTYQISEVAEIFLTNFYPLLFGIPSITLIFVMFSLYYAWRKKSVSTTIQTRLIISLITFILLYFVGATINQVVLINRYQIILYPLMGIMAGIGFTYFMLGLKTKYAIMKKMDTAYNAGIVFVVAILGIVLLQTPFPMSFASELLPKEYTVDIKDMGSGSYEAAHYLNNLPNAKDLVIWTDKRGVCKFFVGVCTDGFDFTAIPPKGLDYVVISAGRESRTKRMMTNPYLLNDYGLIRFDTYYEKNNPLWEIFINERPGQFVKIFRYDPSL